MARPKKSSVLDFRILFLAVFILACLFAIGVRLWFVQVRMADFYRGRIQGSSEVTVRIQSAELRSRFLSPGPGQWVQETVWPAPDA
jgi:cell division protein FtsI/penicillin-binding protein 2